MQQLQSASVFGLGKLGACIAATLASRGFEVVGIDVDARKVAALNAGTPPVEEPHLAETLQEGRSRLRASTDPAEAVATDVSFFITPTPSQPDGSFSSEFLLAALRGFARAVKVAGKTGHLFAVSSTTTPGSMHGVIRPLLEAELAGQAGRDFGLCYNPEFIALGDVIRGLLEPDMVLIGESDPVSGEALAALYRRYNRNQPPIRRMSLTSAELAKISLNSYVTMKISFTNQLRLIAERFPEANIHDILGAVGSDSRVGKKYLRPGLSFGGPCFPRDNRLVAYTARQLGLSAPLAEATDRVNDSTNEALLRQVCSIVAEGDSVAVLGLAYKPDTYITEESAGLILARGLAAAGRRVLVHDYVATPAKAPDLTAFGALPLGALVGEGWPAAVKAIVICSPDTRYRAVTMPAAVPVLDPWGVRA